MKKNTLPILVFGFLLIFWEAAVRLLSVPLYVLPAPSRIALALLAEKSVLLRHAAVTMLEAVCGILISLVLSLAFGILMDCFPRLRRSLYPVLVITQTIPMLVLAPLFIIYFGFGMTPKILTVILMCFFPIVVSFSDGLSQVNPDAIHLIRSYGAKTPDLYRLVKIPASLPALFSGLKVAATYSVSGAVVGEWIGAQSGLGYYLLRVKNSYMLDRVFACVILIILLSLAMNGIAHLLERRFTPA